MIAITSATAIARRLTAFAATMVVAGTLIATLASASVARPMVIGIFDPSDLWYPSQSVSDTWATRAASLGARATRIPLYWRIVAPSRASGLQARNPADRRYHWGAVDNAVRAASARRMIIILTVADAPNWAQRRGGPQEYVERGAWVPSSQAFADFGYAVAKRYSGRFPDPLHRHRFLPAVHYLQAWNEPNLATYLAPQWGRTRSGKIVPVSPIIYRRLLNAFYSAVKRAVPADRVIAAGTAPYGDPSANGRGTRMRPVTFLEDLFCLKPGLHPAPCPEVPHLDAVDHHPYALSPILPAKVAGDISVVDLWKIRLIANAAVRYHRVSPDTAKPLWVTEIDWSSFTPLNAALQARFLAEGMYQLWRQGVSVALWFQLHDDDPPIDSFSGAGLMSPSGSPKPAAGAYLFPFCAIHFHRRLWTVWGRAPVEGRVTIQRLSRRGWRTIASLPAPAGGYFTARLPLGWGINLRAVVQGHVSPTWDTAGRY